MDNDYTARVAKKSWPKKIMLKNCPEKTKTKRVQFAQRRWMEFENLLPSKDVTVMTHESPTVQEWKQNRGKVWQPSILSCFFIHGMWLRLTLLVDYDKEKWSSASACIAFSASSVLCFVDFRKDKTVFPKCCVWDLLLWEIHATAVKRIVNALRPTQLGNCHTVLFLANPEQMLG